LEAFARGGGFQGKRNLRKEEAKHDYGKKTSRKRNGKRGPLETAEGCKKEHGGYFRSFKEQQKFHGMWEAPRKDVSLLNYEKS